MWVQIFEELNKRFKMKYYAHSCSLNPDSAYFTLEQMKRITDNGKLLSGKSVAGGTNFGSFMNGQALVLGFFHYRLCRFPLRR